MAASSEYTFEYLACEVATKAQNAAHHQHHGRSHHMAEISPQIADLVLRTQILNSKLSDINLSTKSLLLSPSQSTQLINRTVDLLLKSSDTGIETLKMQFTVSTMAKELDNEITKRIESQRTMFSDRIEEIIQIIPYNTSTINKLYEDVFELLLDHEKYIESIAEEENIDNIAEREMNAALENVFPRSQIKHYKALSKKAKKVQIDRLIDIIYGIRLYDRDIGKCGSSMTDFPKLIEMELSEMYGVIGDAMESVQGQIESYNKVIELEYHKPGTITAPLLTLQSELRNRWQYVEYLKHYKDEIIQSTEILHTVLKKFGDELKSLHSLFKSEQNPLKTEVYPKFAQLATFWKLILAEKYCAESRQQIIDVLKGYEMAFTSSLKEQDVEKTISATKTEHTFIPFHAVTKLNSNIMQIDHDIFDPKEVGFNGFCLVSMVQKNGMLFSGNTKQTLIQLNSDGDEVDNKENEDTTNNEKKNKMGNKYCFKSMVELKEFAISPPKYFKALQQCLVRYPELINIIGLNDRCGTAPELLVGLQLNSMLPHPMTNVPRKVSQGVGTPTHFVESKIVPDYSWNEWDLRRRALQIVNMRLKKVQTHSTQTDLSHFRRDNATQYYLKQFRFEFVIFIDGPVFNIVISLRFKASMRFETSPLG